MWLCFKRKLRAAVMAQRVRALATKTDNLSWNPEPTWWKDRTNSYTLSFDFHTCNVACAYCPNK